MEELTTQEAMELLENSPVAHLGVIVDGVPYVTPMSYVMDGDRIRFRTMQGKKLEGIKSNPTVCIEVSRLDGVTGEWVSVVVIGAASEVIDEKAKAETTSLLFRKYREILGSPLSHGPGMRPLPGLPHVIEVTIEEMTGMSSGRGFSVRTKPGRL